MHAQLAWFAVILLLALAVASSVRFAAGLSGADGLTIPVRRNCVVVAASAATLVLVGLLWRITALARLDGEVVEQLSRSRKPSLEGVFAVLTNLGDALPATVLAGAIASVLFVRTGSFVAWMLPVVVLVEQVLQVTTANVLHARSVAELVPHVVTGSGGTLPSGSVPRLFAVFMVAALLWGRREAAVARRFRSTATVLVLVQAVSRIYLGRHLLVDLVAGLVLALLLVAAANVVVALLERRWPGLGIDRDARDPRRERAVHG